MKTVKQMVRWLGWAVGIFLLLLLGLYAAARLAGPNAAEREALATLDVPDALPGRNAFPRLWLLEYDAPETEWAGVVADDVARIGAALARRETGDMVQVPMVSVALDRFDRLTTPEDPAAWCRWRQADCIDRIRAAPEDFADFAGRHAALIARAEGLHAEGHYATAFPSSMYAPIPALRGLAVLPTARAVAFVEGRHDEALAGTCADVSAFRRLASNSDSLIVAMVAAAHVEEGAMAFAKMLSELPLDHPLPEACEAAFDPGMVSPDLCMAMKGEARMSRWTSHSYETRQHTMAGALLFDPQATFARIAPMFAYACSATVRHGMADDAPLPPSPEVPSQWTLACVGNPIGCYLAAIAIPAYPAYLLRMQDMHATLRLVDAMRAMRPQSEALAEDEHAARLQHAVGAERELHVDPVAGTVAFPLRGRSSPPQRTLALPGMGLPRPAMPSSAPAG